MKTLHALLVAAFASLAVPPALADGAGPAIDLSVFPDAKASDPVALGMMTGAPPAPDKLVRWIDGSHMKFPQLRWTFNHFDQLAPSVAVWRGTGPVSELPRAEQALDDIAFSDMTGVRHTFAEVLDKSWTDSVLVLHRGRIVYEKYRAGAAPERPHIAMSVTKSFVGLLAAMLAHEGVIDPAAQVTKYVPELAGTAWGDATLRQVMDMTTGVQYSETYADPKAEVWEYIAAAKLTPPRPGTVVHDSMYSFLKSIKKEGAHDQAFAYKTVNTEVLGWVIRRATGQNIEQLLSARIWQKLGAENDARFLVDAAGTAVAGGGLNPTLRDMARFGEMMRLGGKFNGQQIVPAAVVADIAAGADKAKFAKAGYATLPNWSYRNMWWVSDQGYYMARGVYGQAIYIDPKHEVVIVKFGSHPIAANAVQDPIVLPAYRAVAAYLAMH